MFLVNVYMFLVNVFVYLIYATFFVPYFSSWCRKLAADCDCGTPWTGGERADLYVSRECLYVSRECVCLSYIRKLFCPLLFFLVSEVGCGL